MPRAVTTSFDRFRRRTGVALVEILVTIGILLVVFGLVLGAIQATQRRAKQAKCATALRVIGHAFYTYAADNRGWWPMALNNFAPPDRPDTRENRFLLKTWRDYVSAYLGTPINISGDAFHELYAAGVRKGPLWGCPEWAARNEVTGYAMNIYPRVAPGQSSTFYGPGTADWVVRYSRPPVSDGRFFRQSEWSRPSERALVYESVEDYTSIPLGWPWWEQNGPMPPTPHPVNFPGDFNRHSRRPRGTSANEKALNVLFCDGHVESVSAKGLFRAVSMRDPGGR